MACRVDPLTNASVEATLCDWLQGIELPEEPTQKETYALYSDFLSKYHVNDWGITVSVFTEFVQQAVCGERCESCGERAFPYFLQGTELCVKCLT